MRAVLPKRATGVVSPPMLDELITLGQFLAENEARLGSEGIGVALWESGRPLYRLVGSETMSRRDFTSQYEKHKPCPALAPSFIVHLGISTFDTPEKARTRAMRSGWLAELLPTPGFKVAAAKTMGPGHFTIFGDPDVLRSMATVVEQFTV
jgi:hypothetical protein